MTRRKLAREVIALIHHVELNKAGWWQKAIKRMILGALWITDHPLEISELVRVLKSEDFGINMRNNQVLEHLDELCDQGTVVNPTSSKYRLSESAKREFENEIKLAESIEQKAKDLFCRQLEKYCPDINANSAWNYFCDDFLRPLFIDHGAKVYELITGEQSGERANVDLAGFLGKYDSKKHMDLKMVVSNFLDPRSESVRDFILCHLNAYFFIEAGNLRQETIDVLSNLGETKPSCIIFVDTNFLYSILELHDNPSNEAAMSLKRLVDDLKDRIDINMYVLEPTIDETHRRLEYDRLLLKGVKITPNLAYGISKYGIYGTYNKLISESINNNIDIDVDTYFNPYLHGLIDVVKSKGVIFYEHSFEDYSMDVQVMDDINNQIEHEKRIGHQRPKTYEAWKHDVIVWHFINEARPAKCDSPLEAKYWIVTIDYRFMRYDNWKRKNTNKTIPFCVHPTTLIQMLQFWIPRTAEYDTAIIGSIRLPFLFQDFDSEAEKITLKIIRSLGRYENIDDLSPDCILKILMNYALREKMTQEHSIAEEAEIMQEALIEINRETKNKLDKTIEENEKRMELLVESQKEIVMLKREKEDFVKDLEDKDNIIRNMEQKIEQNAQVAVSERQNLKEEIEKLKREQLVRDLERKRKYSRFKFASIMICCFVIGGIPLGYWLVGFVEQYVNFEKSYIYIVAYILITISWLSIVSLLGKKYENIVDWAVYKRIRKLSKWIYGSFWTIILSLIASIIWDVIENK